jgi:hypothetical protein
MKKVLLLVAMLFVFGTTFSQKKVVNKVQTIKLGNLEIYKSDLLSKYGKNNYVFQFEDAEKACAALGNGWRLPTYEELKNMYDHKSEIGNMGDHAYWTSTLVYQDSKIAYYIKFWDGVREFDYNVNNSCHIRPVRTK